MPKLRIFYLNLYQLLLITSAVSLPGGLRSDQPSTPSWITFGNFALISCFILMIVLFTYFWSSDPLSHPYSQALTLTPYSHVHISDLVIPLSHYTSSHFSLYHTHTTIITHLLSHLILLNTMHLNSPTII